MNNWKVVSGENNSKTEIGYPMGQILCTDEDTVNKVVKEMMDRGVKHITVSPYNFRGSDLFPSSDLTILK